MRCFCILFYLFAFDLATSVGSNHYQGLDHELLTKGCHDRSIVKTDERSVARYLRFCTMRAEIALKYC